MQASNQSCGAILAALVLVIVAPFAVFFYLVASEPTPPAFASPAALVLGVICIALLAYASIDVFIKTRRKAYVEIRESETPYIAMDFRPDLARIELPVTLDCTWCVGPAPHKDLVHAATLITSVVVLVGDRPTARFEHSRKLTWASEASGYHDLKAWRRVESIDREPNVVVIPVVAGPRAGSLPLVSFARIIRELSDSTSVDRSRRALSMGSDMIPNPHVEPQGARPEPTPTSKRAQLPNKSKELDPVDAARKDRRTDYLKILSWCLVIVFVVVRCATKN